MKDADAARRLPYGWIWTVFLACMMAGAALLVAGHPGWGTALLLLPLAAALVLTLAYYALERNR